MRPGARFIVVCGLLLALTTVSRAQAPGSPTTAAGSTPVATDQAEPAPPVGTEVLTNDSILEMQSLGFEPALIIEKLNAAFCRFDSSIGALRKLKDGGVPQSVLAAMVRRQQAIDESTARSAPPPPVDPNDPQAPHPAGIYIELDDGEATYLQKIEPSVYSAAKTTGMFGFALTGGLTKMKNRAVLKNAHARTRTLSAKPVFYFYFEVTNSGLSNAGNFNSTSVSPAEFVLVEMESKQDERLLVVGEMSLFSAKSGVADKASRPFDFEPIGPGAYRVVPKNPLLPAEYAFFYAGTTPLAGYGVFAPSSGGKVFDFGVVPRPPRSAPGK